MRSSHHPSLRPITNRSTTAEPTRSQIAPPRQSRPDHKSLQLSQRSQIPLSLPPITNSFSNNRSQFPLLTNRSQISPSLPIDHKSLFSAIDHKFLHLSLSITNPSSLQSITISSTSPCRSQIPSLTTDHKSLHLSLPITNFSISPYRSQIPSLTTDHNFLF